MALFLIILGGLITLGCNGDDELSSDTQVDKDTISYYGDLSITFQLQNMNGTAVTSFDEGENFMFRLVLQNTGKQSMDMPSIRELTQFDLFHVQSRAVRSG